ncbi:DUF4286 family protein [Olivibacter domesticus]|uniref:DUF4286 domain-containing protein n=1 Tax=Olivibacter domesticus TaxID=407022 RepID=A0A1H7VN16_OLID1|nr:protein of unknown function [Olivibacter domesticus]
MVLLNITNIVSDQRVDQYMSWLQREYIPLIQETKHFNEIKLLKILDSPNEGHSFSLQLVTADLKYITTFKQTLYILLQQKMQQELQGHLFLFDSTMQYLDY